MSKGKPEEEAIKLAEDVKRGEGLGLDLIKADIKKYRSGALSSSQMFDKGYNFLLPREYIGAKGGRVGLANGSEGVKQMYMSDEAGVIPKKGNRGITKEDVGLKRTDFDSDENYKRYLRQTNKKAQGGRIGYSNGTTNRRLGDILEHAWWHPSNKLSPKEEQKWKQERLKAIKKAEEEFVEDEVFTKKDIFERDTPITEDFFKSAEGFTFSPIQILRRWLAEKELKEKGDTADEGYTYNKAQGGRINKYGGGVMAAMPRIPTGMPRVNAGGVGELDYRQEGGFVPVGVKEKADDVPAMLSKNEFVMTADAVKGAGGGNVEKGAQRMYDTMKSLEKRIV